MKKSFQLLPEHTQVVAHPLCLRAQPSFEKAQTALLKPTRQKVAPNALLVPPACEKLPKGPVVLVTSREGEEGKRKDNHPQIYPYSAAFPYISFNLLQFLSSMLALKIAT